MFALAGRAFRQSLEPFKVAFAAAGTRCDEQALGNATGSLASKTLTPAAPAGASRYLDEKAFAVAWLGATARVKADKQQAESLQISGTPTFLVGRIGVTGMVSATRRLTGARPAAEFIAAIDAALAEGTDPASNGRATKSSSLR
jgi:hypothetical protein